MLRIQVFINENMVAEANAENVGFYRSHGYDVTAVTHASKDGSHGKHEIELKHRNGDQTVWRLVEEISREIAKREQK
jgi:hypothetical protein